jgi:methenyltetrahydromethanopterin cyclohydrolase
MTLCISLDMPTLNEHAWRLCDRMTADADRLAIAVRTLGCGTRVIDCGVEAPGSIETGVRLAEVCTAGLAIVRTDSARPDGRGGLAIEITTDRPIAACMAAQYAGWEIRGDDYFAMGSGPMRAAAGREGLFDVIGHRERPPVCVGVLESGRLPPEAVCVELAAKCGVGPERLTLLVARTASPAGTIEIVARSVETALHKLHELGFDLSRIERGRGTAPLPPLADDDLVAIGRTNDAILYGGHVTLDVRGDDASLERIGPQVPSDASPDHGRPFAEIFARYDHDFYRVDRALFSPAVVELRNVDTGRALQYGRFEPEVLAESFGDRAG